MLDIKIEKATNLKAKTPDDQLGFGRIFTDHMFIMDYSDEKGWYDPRIIPFQNISLSPAACVFHYGAEVFEGLKAYRRPDGGPGRSWLRQAGGVLQRRGGQPLHGRRLPRRGRGRTGH